MRKLHRVGLILGLVSMLAPSMSFGDDCINSCSRILTSPIFTTKTVKQGSAFKSSFKSLLCTAEWNNYEEAQKAGIAVDLPIYDMIVPLSAHWDNSKRDAWKKTSCSQQDRKTDYTSAFYSASYEVNPITATSWTQCIKDACVPASLACGLEQTSSAVVFEARWRRSQGEADAEAPHVSTFSVKNTKCTNASDLAPGKVLKDASVSILCSENLTDAPTFLLVTNRGSCVQATDLTKSETALSGTVVLDKPTTYEAARLALKSDLKIVTNGYPLTLKASVLSVEGSPQIVSFEPRSMGLGEGGRSAAYVHIIAQHLQGAGLSIENFGEDGGKGQPGPVGGKGVHGSKGSPRYLNLGGCQGGTNGSNGGQGLTGGQGYAGAGGGSAGEVTINIHGFQSGPLQPILVATNKPGRDCKGMICGGLGGPGGDGGPGGPGGDPGLGADGGGGCGGTNAGNPGPGGPGGPGGPTGPNGDNAPIRIFP